MGMAAGSAPLLPARPTVLPALRPARVARQARTKALIS